MLRRLSDLRDYTLRTQDGASAPIYDFIIDDFNWLVRYVVAQVGDRLVALSATVFTGFDDQEQAVVTRLNEAVILDGPAISPGRALSREDEMMLSEHYGWKPYWLENLPSDVPTTMPGDLTAIPLLDMQADLDRERERLVPVTSEAGKETHLRSAREILGYTVSARGEDAGKLTDILVQSSDWDLHYLEVDTGGMLPGKKVGLSPQWVQRIDPDASQILVDLDRDTLHNSPSVEEILQ